MFGIGWTEIVIVFGIVLLVFGPKRLPEIGVAIGKALRMFKDASREIQESMSEVNSEIRSEMHEAKKAGRDLTQALLKDQTEYPPAGGPDAVKPADSNPPVETDRPEAPDDSNSHSPLAG